MKKHIIIISVLSVLASGLVSVKGHALDYPHFGGNNIGCNSCHFVYGTEPSLLPPWTAHVPQDIDDTQYNTLCWSCHNDIESPYVRTHSSLQIDDRYGDWSIECVTCHNPHYQKQADTYGSAGYLYSGASTNVTATTITKTGAGWTTNEYKGLVVVPNTAQNKYKYKIAGNSGDTITVAGPMDLTKVSAGNTFAVVYGKLIESTIGTPNSGDRSVRFFNNTGTNSFADGNSTYDGVCEVCHTRTLYHRNDAAGSHTHNTGLTCTICHQHTDGFKGAGCDVCHGYPPVIDTATGGPDGLVNNPGTTGSTTAGAHDKHVKTKFYPCEYCHYNSVGSGPLHNDGPPQDITIGFSLFGGAYSGGIYDGQPTAGYDSSEVNTTVISPGSGSNTCSNIYCHGELSDGSKWGSGVNTTPAWDAAGVSCGDCHLATNADPPTLGSHKKHTGDTAPDLNLPCTLCHSGYTNRHADSQVTVSFAADSRVNGGSYNGTAAMLDAYGQCSNIYCHSDVQNSTGTGGPTSYANPQWGSGALACDSCHGYPPNTGTHLTHINSTHHADAWLPLACNTCHAGSTHANGSVDVSSNSPWVANFAYTGGGPPGNGYGFCAGACHDGAVWNGPPIYCYDCHRGEIDKLTNYPAPQVQTAPAIIPEPDVMSPTDVAVTLEWYPAPSVSGPPSYTEYYVEVDDDPTYNTPDYHSSWITGTSWTVTLETSATWYWRVRARDAVRTDLRLTSAWQTDSFQIISPGSPPAPAPVPEPDFDSGGSPLNIVLQWTAVTDPEGDPVEYYVEVSLQNDFSNPALVSGWITGTQFTFQTSCSGVYWRVRARDATSGAVSPWSSVDYFQDIFNCGGSCPFLYVWDGNGFDFGTDLNGPGKLAAKSANGYFKPNPNEYYILGTGPVEKDGYYEMRLVEERYEVNYLDMLKLYSVDVPDNREVYAEKSSFDTPFNGLPQSLHTVDRNLSVPLSVIHVNTGEDVSDKTSSSDGNYVILSNDRNLDFDYNTLELDLGDLSQAPQIKLIMDGLSAFPTTPEGVSRSQQFGPRTKIEVQDANGEWVAVSKAKAVLPKLPEFKRPFVLDISNIFVTGIYKVRLTFLFKTYIDSISFDTTADEAVILNEVPLFSADLHSYGHSAQSFFIDDLYEYVYSDVPNHEHEYFPGSYTRYGEVGPLLSGTDDIFVIYGSGDEIALRFNPAGNAPPGYARKFLVYTNGYYKDGKVDVARTVAPLPFAGMSNFPYDPAVEHYPDDAAHNQYLLQYNTRSQ